MRERGTPGAAVPAEGTCSAWGAAHGVSQLLLDVFSPATSTKPPQISCAAPVVGPASLHRAGTGTTFDACCPSPVARAACPASLCIASP